MSVYYTAGLFFAKVEQPQLENSRWRSRWTAFYTGQICSDGSCTADTQKEALLLAEKAARAELTNLNGG